MNKKKILSLSLGLLVIGLLTVAFSIFAGSSASQFEDESGKQAINVFLIFGGSMIAGAIVLFAFLSS